MASSATAQAREPFKTRTLIANVVGDFRCSWKSLALTDFVFKIISFVILLPLASILLRTLVATSGSKVLSDQDILYFLLGPAGWLCFIVVAAVWLAIVALEQAALMAILCASATQQRIGLFGALRFCSSNTWPVFRVTARIVAWTTLAVVPFVLAAAAVYFALLRKHDINYYLQQRPPSLLVAATIGSIIVAALAILLLRLFTSWLFALPLVLFENVRPTQALRESAVRARGRRRTLLIWAFGWLLTTSMLSMLVTGTVGLLARWIIPQLTGSFRLLTIAMGITLLAWVAATLAVNLLSTMTFAAIVFRLYRNSTTGSGPANWTWNRSAQFTGISRFSVTPGRLLAAGILGIVMAVTVGVFVVRSVRLDDRVKIMAHRGSSSAAPENTLAAIRQAIADGADYVEIDVQETADGEVVVFHDSDFMRLSGNTLKIWNATQSDLKTIDIGSWFSPEFKAERVPTLSEALAACKGKILVNIELKYYGHDKQLEQRVADIVESHDMAEDIVLMSLSADGVRKMKSIRPAWKVGQLMSISAGNRKQIEADFLAVNAKFVNRRVIRDAHQSSKEIYVWTVDDGPSMSTLIGLGVDGLLTNNPAIARSVLEQRAQLSVPERLLLELARILGVTPHTSYATAATTESDESLR